MSFLLHRVRGGFQPGGEIAGTALVQFVEGDALRIGRDAGVQLRLDEPTVSLEHARLQLYPSEGGRLEVVDLGSLTGTYVNGKRVERATLVEGDWIEIGRHRLSVHLESPSAVVLYLQELAEERPAADTAAPTGAEAKLTTPQVDYFKAYDVRRGALGPGPLAFLAVAVVLAAVALGAWRGRSDLFRPGPVSQAHTGIADRCGACHTPWRGADDKRCAACHAGPEHHATAALTPSCATCHVEHRFEARLALVGDRLCVDCHRELRLDGGAAPRFARRVTDFAVDHPQLALTAADGSRLPLDQPAARRADPGTLAFGHALHLAPGLRSPRGTVQLDCFSCHAFDARSGKIAPVVYERHCQDCHRLTFDPRTPEAPHERPEVVHAFLLRTYAERKEQVRPLPVQRRLLPRRSFEAAPPPVIRLDERVLRQVVEAEVNLYRSSCSKCHGVDLDVVPPAVTPPAIPSRWLVHSRFTHEPHRMVACTSCHAGAAASAATADVLLPGIAVCRNCHGPQQRGSGVAAGATTSCISCHEYHDKTRTGEWQTTSGLASTMR